MDLTRAIQLYKNQVKFGDIRQQEGLTHSQMYFLDAGLRMGKSQSELELKMDLVNDDMKSWDIKEILEK